MRRESPAFRHSARARAHIGIALVFGLLLAACGDDGVVVGNGESGNTAGGGGTGDAGNTDSGGVLDLPPTNGEPSGEIPATTAASRLDADDVAAARFLMQASFGPSTESLARYREFDDRAVWIDWQMQLPASLTEPYTRENSNGSHPAARHEIWWQNALNREDQLRQRVAFALSQIFVVSDIDYALANQQYGMSNYYDMLAGHAFGNYRELLEDVALHPVMGVYLSMVRNERANPAENIRPDENFAREVMQLFSIGLFELEPNGEFTNPENPVPTYTQDTVEEFARVFTGWNYDLVSWDTTNLGNQEIFTTPMVPFEQYHDDGEKTLLNGAVAPAGLSTRDDLEFALDNIANHPNVAPFIGKQLIQRLVTSNPTPAYVARVSAVFNDNGNGERGDLAAVVRAILLDEEAVSGHETLADFGKLKEPVIRWAGMWRALDATTGPEANGIDNTPDFLIHRIEGMGGQAVMRSPSVFNFYLPDNPIVPGGSLLSPEMQIMSEANLGATHNNYHHQIYRFNERSDLSDDNPRVDTVDLEPFTAIAGDIGALLDRINLYLFAGGMPDTQREIIAEYLRTLGNDDAGRFARAQDALFLALVSPQQQVQR